MYERVEIRIMSPGCHLMTKVILLIYRNVAYFCWFMVLQRGEYWQHLKKIDQPCCNNQCSVTNYITIYINRVLLNHSNRVQGIRIGAHFSGKDLNVVVMRKAQFSNNGNQLRIKLTYQNLKMILQRNRTFFEF